MDVPHKNQWKVTASSGDPRLAIDDNYATTWHVEAIKEAVAGDRPWRSRDARRTRSLLGQAGSRCIYGFEFLARRQNLGASL